MSSASSWGRTRRIVSWQFPPGVGEINKAKCPESSASQWKIPVIPTSKKLGFTWLIHLNFNDTCSLLSWQNLLCTTVNKDHKSIREMNLAIKSAARRMGKIPRRFATNLGNVILPATLSSLGTRTVASTLTRYPDYRSKQCACPQNLLFVRHLFLLIFLQFAMRN